MTSRSLPLVWTSNLPEQDKKDFEGALRNSTLVLGRLREILEQKISQLRNDELSDGFYEKENVFERHLFNQGRIRELRDTLNLLSFF